MKEFKLDHLGHFVCEECNKTFAFKKGLSKHINQIHDGVKLYFDKWVNDGTNGKCKICDSPTKFQSLIGYKNCCSSKCTKKYNHIQSETAQILKYGHKTGFGSNHFKSKTKETINSKYNVDNISQLESIKKQKEQTCLFNYGVKAGFADKEKREQTCLEKYGNKHYKNFAKNTQTCLTRYNVKYTFQSPLIKEKIKQSILTKYGVENVMHNQIICDRAQKNGFFSHKYKNTNIYYQGSYELDFLEKYYNKFPDIQRGPTIRYINNNKNKIYYPDFYIPSLNLVIEIKSSYWYKAHKESILLKEEATKKAGYIYIIIINKEYSIFNNYLQLSFW